MQEMLPKYYVLKKELLRRIEAGEYADGALIESERELMETYQFSRVTVRKAIDELVNEGYLYRIQGKGTYVKSEEATQNLYRLSSCTEDVKRMGCVPTKKTVYTTKQAAGVRLARQLHIDAEDQVHVIGRVFYADEETLNYTDSYLAEKLFPGLEQYNLEENSLYDIIQNVYQIKITKARRTIEAVLPYPDVADYLGISENMPVILFHCITYGIVHGKEVPIEKFRCYYRTDQYKFYIDQVN